MASPCNRFIPRSLYSVKSAVRNGLRSSLTRSSVAPSATGLPLRSKTTASSLRRFFSSRSPAELGCVQSLLPLHSVVASARMTSCLSTTSRSCRALSQVFGPVGSKVTCYLTMVMVRSTQADIYGKDL